MRSMLTISASAAPFIFDAGEAFWLLGGAGRIPDLDALASSISTAGFSRVDFVEFRFSAPETDAPRASARARLIGAARATLESAVIEGLLRTDQPVVAVVSESSPLQQLWAFAVMRAGDVRRLRARAPDLDDSFRSRCLPV